MQGHNNRGRHPFGPEFGPVIDAVLNTVGHTFDPDGEEGGERGPRGRGGKSGRGRGERADRGERRGREEGEERAGRGHGRGRGGHPGGPRGRRGMPEQPDASDAGGWFAGRLPDDWFVGVPEVIVDREEITVIGELPPLADTQSNAEPGSEPADAAATAAAEAGRISRFREDTRDDRIEIARQAEHRYDRKVSWGARIGDTEQLFTTQSVPVMTRLRQSERQVLDTLVAAGVARSRSDALAWAVRLVAEHTDSWLSELRTAMEEVDKLRAQGPDLD